MLKILKLNRRKRKPEFFEQKRISEGCWIYAIDPTPEENDRLCNLFKIEREFINEMIDDESTPRIEKERDYIAIVFRAPIKLKSGSIITAPFGIIYHKKKKIILTVQRHHMGLFSQLIKKTPKDLEIEKLSSFLVHTIQRSICIFMKHLSMVEKEIEIAEISVADSLENKEILKLLSAQKTLVYFRTSMVGNKKIVEKLISGKVVRFSEEGIDDLQDALIDINEAQQIIDIDTEILSNTMDAYTSIVSNNMNIVFKFLAFITLVMSIPTAIASIYGMNIPLPFQNSPLMFWVVLFASSAISAMSVLYFKKKGWM